MCAKKFHTAWGIGKEGLDKFPNCTVMNTENVDQILEKHLQFIGKDVIKQSQIFSYLIFTPLA